MLTVSSRNGWSCSKMKPTIILRKWNLLAEQLPVWAVLFVIPFQEELMFIRLCALPEAATRELRLQIQYRESCPREESLPKQQPDTVPMGTKLVLQQVR